MKRWQCSDRICFQSMLECQVCPCCHDQAVHHHYDLNNTTASLMLQHYIEGYSCICSTDNYRKCYISCYVGNIASIFSMISKDSLQALPKLDEWYLYPENNHQQNFMWHGWQHLLNAATIRQLYFWFTFDFTLTFSIAMMFGSKHLAITSWHIQCLPGNKT